MEAEYFPPKEPVILQNEAPTDVYILVSGAVVSISIFLKIIILLPSLAGREDWDGWGWKGMNYHMFIYINGKGTFKNFKVHH